MTWAASVFGSGQDQFGNSLADAGGVGTAERITWCPYYDEPSDGRYYLHLGLAHHMSAPPNERAAFRTIPEMYVGDFIPEAFIPGQQPTPTLARGVPFFVNTGVLAVESFNVIGTEVLWVDGPLSVQSEVMVNFVDQIGNVGPGDVVIPNATFAVLPGFSAHLKTSSALAPAIKFAQGLVPGNWPRG
jgi:phosphate-selective porin OprO and OprP